MSYIAYSHTARSQKDYRGDQDRIRHRRSRRQRSAPAYDSHSATCRQRIAKPATLATGNTCDAYLVTRNTCDARNATGNTHGASHERAYAICRTEIFGTKFLFLSAAGYIVGYLSCYRQAGFCNDKDAQPLLLGIAFQGSQAARRT